MMILMINQPTSTVFYMKNNFWTKISKNGHCELYRGSEKSPLAPSNFSSLWTIRRRDDHTVPPYYIEDCRTSNVEHLGDLVYVRANIFSFGSLCFVLLCSHAPAHYASTAPSTFFSLGTLVSFCLTFLTGHRGKSNLKQICPHQNGGRSETYLKLKKKGKCMHIDSHVF